MKVYGLTGKSGTGKSYQSINVCRERGIEAIIDDGLFIYKNTIQAGHSAKRDENKMTAIKTAIFYKEEERAAVAEKIHEISPNKILVLGTSEEMIEKICTRLNLCDPKDITEMIHIEDIVSEKEIAKALRQRKEKGKHVIPVPTVEIKSQFSGYFMMPMRLFRKKNGVESLVNEKSVVRPSYSYLGEFSISDKAVADIVEYAAGRSLGVADVNKCVIRKKNNGVIINIAAIFEYDRNLRSNIDALRENVTGIIEHMTAFHILSVNVIVKGLKPSVRK